MDAPAGLSAWQSGGDVHLCWQKPQSIQLYPADWISYNIIRNNSVIGVTRADTIYVDHVMSNMTAYYRVIAQYRDGLSLPSEILQFNIDLPVNEVGSLLPKAFSLSQNFPNPFNPVTHIKLEIPAATNGSLRIYDICGRLVRVLAEGNFEPGYRDYVWDGCNESSIQVSAGMYFYRFAGEQYSATKKMLLIK